MALIPCPECGHKVSLAAAHCPQCGCPNPSATVMAQLKKREGRRKLRFYAIAFLVLFVLLMIFGANVEGSSVPRLQ